MSSSKKSISATFVVVGGGIAGISCIEGINFLNSEADIILLTPTPVVKAVTNVTNLTKTLCKFDVGEQAADTLCEIYPSLSIIHDSLASVDLKNNSIHTENGAIVQYQKLCICTGGHPRLIVQDNPHVIGLRDVESVKEFQKKIAKARKILVVGNGGIATEIVHEIEGVDMIWVIKDTHIAATFVDPGAAEFFQSRLFKKEEASDKPKSPTKRLKYTISSGVSSHNHHLGAALGPDWHEICEIRGNVSTKSQVIVEYECEVKRLLTDDESKIYANDPTHWPIYAELTNGKVFGIDFVVSATGIIPNTSNVQDVLELAVDGGIVVNERMETSHPDVFAAGDACTASWEKAQHWFQMRLWTQARQMGLYVAKCMVASMAHEPVLQDFCFEMFSHVTKFFDYKVVLLGLYNGQTLGEYEILLRMTKAMEYIKLVMKDGKMHGAVLIGDTDLEEMCENLILNQLDLSIYGEDLLNPNIDIEDYFD